MKLDGRTKLISCIFLILFMFSFNYYWQYFLIFFLVGLILIFEFSGAERKQIFRHWKLICLLPILNLFINLFFVNGDVIWSWGLFHLTDLDIQIFIRIILMLIIALMLTIKTTPNEMALSVGKIANDLTFGKYQGMGVPIVIIIMGTFISEFKETFITVKNAYILRRNNYKSKIKEIKNYIFLLQPIILVTLKKANRVSDSLIAKGYHRGAKIFDYQAIKYQKVDFLVYLGLICLFVGRLIFP